MSFGIDIYSGWRAIRKFIVEPLRRLLHPKRR
jgi:hypothetical protein